MARECFTRNGYENTSTQEVLERSSLSRGALYHHFKSKQDLFEAVFIAISDEAIEYAVKHGARGKSPLEDLTNACLAWLRAAQRPEVAAILLDQGPMVLGWKRARDLEAESSLALMRQSLERAVAAGELEVHSIPFTARLLNAIVAEAALSSLHDKPRITRATQQATIRQFIEGLRIR